VLGKIKKILHLSGIEPLSSSALPIADLTATSAHTEYRHTPERRILMPVANEHVSIRTSLNMDLKSLPTFPNGDIFDQLTGISF
jgi:hypothetical protein